MKKISVAKRTAAALTALVLLFSCVLTVLAGTAFKGDSNTNKAIVRISSSGGGWIDYVVNGVSNGTSGMYLSRSVPIGAACTATASDTVEKPFLYWLDDFGGRICSYEPTISFTVGSRVSYTAVFKKDASQRVVQFLNYGGNPLLTSYTFEQGATVTPPANPYAAGFTFRKWSATTSEINSSSEDMIVTPVFDVKQESYTVAITNDAYVSGAGTYGNYATVNLKAEEKNGAGEAFSYWKDSEGQIVSYDRNYSFRINYDVTLTAVYGESVIPEPVIRLTRVYRDPNNYNMTVFAERSVPEGYTVVSHGMLMSVSATVTDAQMTVANGDTLPNAAVRKVYGNSNEPCGTFSLAKGQLVDSTTVTSRAFLIYQDVTGKEFIVYSDILRTTNAD